MYSRFVVNLLLRISLHFSASGLPGMQRSLLLSVIKRPLSQEENKALNSIRKLRRKLLQQKEPIEMVDYGAGGEVEGIHLPGAGISRRRSIAKLASEVAIPDAWGVFLFKLVRDFGYCRILELGTSVGLSAAYLAKAIELGGGGQLSAVKLVTLEGDPETAELARIHLASVSCIPVELVVGRFEDTLDDVLATSGPFDFIFLDGHHEHEAVVSNFRRMHSQVAPGGAVLIDDLEPWDTKVRSAWAEIKTLFPENPAIDLFRMGLMFRLP